MGSGAVNDNVFKRFRSTRTAEAREAPAASEAHDQSIEYIGGWEGGETHREIVSFRVVRVCLRVCVCACVPVCLVHFPVICVCQYACHVRVCQYA